MKMIGWENLQSFNPRPKQHFVVMTSYRQVGPYYETHREPVHVTLCGSTSPLIKKCTMRLTADPKVDCKTCMNQLRKLVKQLLNCDKCSAGAAITLCANCDPGIQTRASELEDKLFEMTKSRDQLQDRLMNDDTFSSAEMDEVLRVRGDIPRHEEAP